MKPGAFEYTRPASLDQAIRLLGDTEAAMPFAGGQSLLVLLRLRLATASLLVDVRRLPGLSDVTETGDVVHFGAATTHAAIEDQRFPDPTRGFMAHVAGSIAYRSVRNFGTIGGSLALADPAADWPCALLALGATVHVVGASGARLVPIDDFLQAPFTTALAAGELITGIDAPRLSAGASWGYAKLTRTQGAFAESMAAAVRSVDGSVRVTLGATSGRPMLLLQTMSLLAQGGADPKDIADVVAADVLAADPDADAYRWRCHAAMVRRAVAQMELA